MWSIQPLAIDHQELLFNVTFYVIYSRNVIDGSVPSVAATKPEIIYAIVFLSVYCVVLALYSCE